MKRVFLAIFVLFAVSAGGAVYFMEPDPILIGFSGMLEGKYSDLGVQGRNGVMLSIERFNRAGGINGRKIKLLARNDHNTAQGAIEADRELIEEGVVAIIGHMTSVASLAAQQKFLDTDILFVSPTTSTPLLSGIKDNFFRVMSSNTVWSQGLAKYAYNVGNMRKVVCVYDISNAAYSAPFVATFGKMFGALGGEIVQEIRLQAIGLESWEPIIDRIVQSNPDAIVTSLSARDLAAFARAMRKRGYSQQIYSAMWSYTKELLLSGGKSVEGIIFSVSFVKDSNSLKVQQFAEEYANRFGWEPSFGAFYGYEAMEVLGAALNVTGGKREGLDRALRELGTVQGILGPLRLDEFGDVVRHSNIVTIRDRKFVNIGVIEE